MGGIWIAFRAEQRRRWASWLALVILVALVGGTTLSGVMAAKRTSSAFPDFIQRYGADAGVYTTGKVPSPSQLRGVDTRLRNVYPILVSGDVTIGSTFIPSSDMSVFALPRRNATRTMKLLSGRLPSRPNEALAGFSLEEQAGLHIGSIVKVPTYLSRQKAEVFSASNNVPAKGPTLVFRIVGFEASMLDFPTSKPSYSIFVSRPLEQATSQRLLWATIGFYRLKNGTTDLPKFTYDVNHLPASSMNFFYPFSLDSGIVAIEGSISPQVVGWWLLALIAGLAGLALIGQALARQSLVERQNFPTLSALGFRSRQLFGLGMARALLVGVAGAVGAVAVAVLLSPLTPVGEARAAEPVHGFVADSLILSLGALAIIVIVPVLALYPSWSGAKARSIGPSRNDTVTHGSTVASVATRAGLPPSVLIGIRHALERGRGRSSVPVVTALLGTAISVAALSAASVFGVSLTHLLNTPSLYGQNWTVDLGGFNGTRAKAVATSAALRPGVDAVTYGIGNKEITINRSTSATLLIAKSAKGPVLLRAVNGHVPDAIGQIGLGSKTMAEAHTDVGATVTVGFIAPNGKTLIGRFKVVGTIVFPPVESNGGSLGDGAIIAYPSIYSLICQTTVLSTPCARSFDRVIYSPNFTNWGMLISTANSPTGRRTQAALERTFRNQLNVITAPVNLVNFGQAVNFPELLGALLALYGAATLVHLLIVSVSRRHREFALLKVLGFVRRQAATALCWQAVTVATVGLILGVPTGIIVGRVAWNSFATSAGAAAVPVVPVALLLEIAGTLLVGATLIAVVPAVVASRIEPATALREA